MENKAQIEYAYAAGLIDGEGSIMLLSGGPKRARGTVVSIGLTDDAPLEWLQSTMRGYISKSKLPHGQRKPYRIWSLKDNAVFPFLRGVRPYLVMERRKALADLVLEEYPMPNIGRDTAESARRRATTAELLFERMQRRNEQRLASLPDMEKTAPTASDFAYLAGILDGEGWIRDVNKTSHGAVADVVSTDPELPAYLKSRFGGAARRVERQPKENHRPTWYWRIGVREGVPVLVEAAEHMLLARKTERIYAFASQKGKPLDFYLPGTAADIADRSGMNYKTVDKKLRAMEGLDRIKLQRGGGLPGRPSWYYFASRG